MLELKVIVLKLVQLGDNFGIKQSFYYYCRLNLVKDEARTPPKHFSFNYCLPLVRRFAVLCLQVSQSAARRQYSFLRWFSAVVATAALEQTEVRLPVCAVGPSDRHQPHTVHSHRRWGKCLAQRHNNHLPLFERDSPDLLLIRRTALHLSHRRPLMLISFTS